MATVQIVQEGVDVNSFEDKELPTDVHLISYTPEGSELIVDAVRAYTMVDIFDSYWDKFEGKITIHSIKSGYGWIKPKLFGKIKSESDEWLIYLFLSVLLLWTVHIQVKLICRLDTLSHIVKDTPATFVVNSLEPVQMI